MTVRVVCPNPDCGQVGSITEASLGRRGRCRQCGRDFDLAHGVPEAASGNPGDALTSEEVPPSAPALAATDLPEQFGRYRIIRPIGQGGMGAVYLAQDTVLGRAVALKVPRFAPAEGAQAIQRFVREARAAATLDHPNLCPVFDVGEVDGAYFLTMPFIEGKPLAEALGRGRTVTEAQAAAVTRKLALALGEAHDRGVVHRDLKPGNIMVNRRRELVIMDFGLARLADGDEAPITRLGHVLGTALYMAPEQATGSPEAGHPAVDVYSLGVILYELLTGVRPFEGPWSLVIGLKSVQDPASPTVHRPDLAPALAAICLKALARRPEDRYASMAEFARALSDFLAVGPGPVPPAPGSPSSDPDLDPDRLAAQVFAGLNSREATSLRAIEEGESLRGPLATVGSPRRPGWAWIAGGGVVACLILGVLLFVATNQRRDTIRQVEGAPRLARSNPAGGAPAEARPPTSPPPLVPDLSPPSDPADGKPATPPTAPGLDPAPAPDPADAPVPAPVADGSMLPGETPTLTEPPASPLAPGTESVPPPVEPASRNRSQPRKKAARSIPSRPLFADGVLGGPLEHRLNGNGATRWSVEGGLLVAQGPRGKLFLFQDSFRDFDLHAEVMRGDNDSTGVLVIRAGERNEGEKEKMAGYSIGLGRAIDTGRQDFGANFDPCAETGSISVWKFLPGRSKPLQIGTSRRPSPGQWFPVDVRVRGNQIQVRINNGPPVQATDPAGLYPTGQVGFKAMGGPDGSTLKIRRIEIRPVE